MACFKGFAELHNMQPFADTAFLLCPLSELQSTTGIRHHDAGSTTGLSVPATPAKLAVPVHDHMVAMVLPQHAVMRRVKPKQPAVVRIHTQPLRGQNAQNMRVGDK